MVRRSLLNHYFAVRALLRIIFTIFWSISELLGVSKTPGVRIPPKIGIFTAPCGSHETPLFRISIKSCLGSIIWEPAETSGSLSKNWFYILLLSKKTLKMWFFRSAPWDFENKLLGGYKLQTQAPYAIHIPASVKVHYHAHLEQGEMW